MKRRDLLKISVLSGLAAASVPAKADTACATDGTPNQFIPKKAADAKPLENEFEKYPKCPYCGMDRKEHHRTRMLVQYADDLDPAARVACETATTTGMVMVMGEISTAAYVDIARIVRNTVREIGYTGHDTGFDADACAVMIDRLWRLRRVRRVYACIHQ